MVLHGTFMVLCDTVKKYHKVPWYYHSNHGTTTEVPYRIEKYYVKLQKYHTVP